LRDESAVGRPPAAVCFHCALPVLEPGRHVASVLGAAREFCCAGCEAVARTIVAGGFERYYETRNPPRPGDGAALLPQDLPPLEIYDDPEAQRQFVAAPDAARHEVSLILDRIRCAACLWLSEQWLRRQPGILRVDINYATHRAQIAWDPARTRLSAILEAVRTIGYDAYPYDPQREDALARRARRTALWRLFVAGFGAMQVMMYAFPAYLDAGSGTLAPDTERLMRWASLLLTLPVIFFSSGPFFAGAWQSLKQRSVSLDAPIALGIAAGFAASLWATLSGRGEVYYDTITMLVFLLLAARMLEAAARTRAARALDPLARWMPSFAMRLAGPDAAAQAQRVPAHALARDDYVLVAPGERLPADGIVARGASSADESLLTGESRPVAKTPGAPLIGGAINLEQPIVMQVTRTGPDTQAAAVLRLVERAAAGKPRLVEAADRLAARLTAVVLLVAAAALLFWASESPARAVWVAVAVLVATCPCALALAAPIVLTRANAFLLSRGLALTRGAAIERLEHATDVVLDKTGTLTAGRFAIRAVRCLGRLDADGCLAAARALEASSRHPIARAFEGPAVRTADAVRNAPGEGLEGSLDGRRVRLGTEAYCRALAGSAPPGAVDAADARQTRVFLADAEGWLAVFVLEDALRPEAQAFVAGLAARGLRVHLASGDHPAAVDAVARHLGIGSALGGATPQDKFAYVEGLQREGRVVLMVGDGLNDAPVLARADVSVAMGSGADAAQAQADLVLLGGATSLRLSVVGEALSVAQRAMRLIRQNFAWAVAYNAVALPLAAIGWIGPWEAAIGMTASSFIVVINAMRPLAPRRGAQRGATEPALAAG
jgi:Cu2+-exporting ATPase